MDIEYLEGLIKKNVIKVEAGGEVFYMKPPNSLTLVAMSDILSKKDLEEREKMAICLSCLICDESGRLKFDRRNESHLKAIEVLDDEYLLPLVETMNSISFSSKKK